MARLAALLALLGLAAATGIILWSGWDAILDALSVAGWGILLTSLAHLVPLAVCVIGWRGLMSGDNRPSFGFLFYILWLRAAVNGLMPVARVGGEVVAVRVMVKQGVSQEMAVASTVVELTLSCAAIFLFILCGIFGLSMRSADARLDHQLMAAAIALLPFIGILIAVQRIGFFGLLDKLFTLIFRDKWQNFAADITSLDRAIHAMYCQRRRIAFCFFWQLVSWTSATGEIWLGLHFLGHALSFADCFILEAMVQGSAAAGFAVPGALGVQEAGFLFFGRLLGLPPEIAAALAVMRRCRDLILFLPGLIAWQVQEGRWILSKPLK